MGHLRYQRLVALFRLNGHDLVGHDSLELWDAFPNRAEPLWLAAQYFRSVGKLNIARLAAEQALTLRPPDDPDWPVDPDAYGLEIELLYARLLADIGSVEESIAHFANIVRNFQHDRELVAQVVAEIRVVANRLDLCEVHELS